MIAYKLTKSNAVLFDKVKISRETLSFTLWAYTAYIFLYSGSTKLFWAHLFTLNMKDILVGISIDIDTILFDLNEFNETSIMLIFLFIILIVNDLFTMNLLFLELNRLFSAPAFLV